jgi:Iron-containing redox enzyme
MAASERQALPSPAAFELPDTMAALPRRPFQFSAAAIAEADAIVALPPEALFGRLLADQESEAVMLAARRVIDAFLTGPGPAAGTAEPGADELDAGSTADEIAARVAEVRQDLAATVTALASAQPATRELVIRQRAALGLLGGCWLDVLSQPATQPSVIVNRLFAQHFTLRGAGNPRRSLAARRRQAMEAAGVFLPDLGAADFLARAGTRPLTALHGCWYLALSRLPASFLPELVGVHYAVLALGVDDLMAGGPPMLAEPDLRAVLAGYLDLAGPAERARLHAGLRLALELEREHVALLAELAAWDEGQSLESKVAAIIARHAPFAGRHHRDVRVGGRRLAEWFADPGLDLTEFLREFRASPQLGRTTAPVSSFIKALKFGGPMFGIFDAGEAEVFQAWAESARGGERPEIVISACTAGDQRAAARASAIAASAPADVVIAGTGTGTEAGAGAPGDRELFYRLVNIENFASTRPLARQRAERLLTEAEVLFSVGAGGRYTDASYFEYDPEALYERCERVYFDKLVRPYEPLTTIPDRDVVVFLQTTYALGALVDAAWIHRTANLGRAERPADAALFAIYADEVGHGDLRKNHITLIHTALASMDIRLPHIREAAFMDQAELPDELYGFSLHQLCMALFPDTFYNEILGYNLAIEMFGLGELRLHEIQKLRHYGFDDCYEQAHLTIDNLSAGHSRQAADIIVTYLDEVRRTLGDAAVQREWRRVWRGYASLAWFVEHTLLRQLADDAAPSDNAGTAGEAEPADLII